mgnify:CR=1 FL=1
MQLLEKENHTTDRIRRTTNKSGISYSMTKKGQKQFMKDWFREMFFLLNRKDKYLVINRINNTFFYGNDKLLIEQTIPIVGIMPFNSDIYDVYAKDEESKKAFEMAYQLLC